MSGVFGGTFGGAPFGVMLFGGATVEEGLLQYAERLKGEGHCEMAVVVAQMAIELTAEAAFEEILTRQHTGHLRPILELLPNFNLGNERVRKTYQALSGNAIQDEPFWADLQAHVQRRNKIVHEGAKADDQAAVASLEVAGQVITHITGVVQSL